MNEDDVYFYVFAIPCPWANKSKIPGHPMMHVMRQAKGETLKGEMQTSLSLSGQREQGM